MKNKNMPSMPFRSVSEGLPKRSGLYGIILLYCGATSRAWYDYKKKQWDFKYAVLIAGWWPLTKRRRRSV